MSATIRADVSPPTAPTRSLGRVLGNETLEELLAVVREPTTLFFSVAMPVGFFALFMTLWGGEQLAGVSVAATMFASFGAFGVIGVTLLTPGIGVAEDRERGWLRAKRVSSTPLPVTLAAKVATCVPHALLVLAAMATIAVSVGDLSLGPATWTRLVLALLLGGLPFALLGLTVGFLASPNAATAVLMAMFIPSAVASGLWMPLDTLPGTIQTLAPALPTYHLAQLALAQLDGGLGLVHVAALVGFAVITAGSAALAYRSTS